MYTPIALFSYVFIHSTTGAHNCLQSNLKKRLAYLNHFPNNNNNNRLESFLLFMDAVFSSIFFSSTWKTEETDTAPWSFSDVILLL